MKLVVIIPCLNEEHTLPLVLKTIPKKITGISEIEVVIVDDGSTDKTIQVAKKHKVRNFVFHKRILGLARSHADGLEKALSIGADIIVNTDGDNQYPQADIPKLIVPILSGKADLVIGNRQTDKINHFSGIKKVLQKIGSASVRFFSGSDVADAVSGFRAYSRVAALKLNLFTNYTYTIEGIIQLAKKNLRIVSVDIITNPKTRESRLIKSISAYLKKSLATTLRLLVIYEPLKVFLVVGAMIMLPGIVAILRFTLFSLAGNSSGHLQSLILGSVLIFMGMQTIVMSILADLIGTNRKLEEEVLYRMKSTQMSQVPQAPSLKIFKSKSKSKSLTPRFISAFNSSLPHING